MYYLEINGLMRKMSFNQEAVLSCSYQMAAVMAQEMETRKWGRVSLFLSLMGSLY